MTDKERPTTAHESLVKEVAAALVPHMPHTPGDGDAVDAMTLARVAVKAHAEHADGPRAARADRGSGVSTRNDRGEWVPAIPLPLYLPFGFTRCECGQKFLGERHYRSHYALVHILGLS